MSSSYAAVVLLWNNTMQVFYGTVALCHFCMQWFIYITGVNLVSSILVYECACLDPLVTWPGFTVASSLRRRDSSPHTRHLSQVVSPPHPLPVTFHPCKLKLWRRKIHTVCFRSLRLISGREMSFFVRVRESPRAALGPWTCCAHSCAQSKLHSHKRMITKLRGCMWWTERNIRIVVFCDMAPFIFVDRYQHFGEDCCLDFQARRAIWNYISFGSFWGHCLNHFWPIRNGLSSPCLFICLSAYKNSRTTNGFPRIFMLMSSTAMYQHFVILDYVDRK
jgi:hypothetical protein